MKNHEDFLHRAIELSKTGSLAHKHGGPFGALVRSKDGIILSENWNRVLATNDPSAHAEVNGIREACFKTMNFDLDGATVYSSCEPCPMCLATGCWANVDKFYYAATQDDADEIGFQDALLYEKFSIKVEPGFSVAIPELREEARKVMLEWKEKIGTMY